MPTVEDTARLLAGEHRREDQGMHTIYWVPAEDQVLLIEVTDSIGVIDGDVEVLPFGFTKDPPDVLYESVVILLGTGEWEQIKDDPSKLPVSFRGDHVALLAA